MDEFSLTRLFDILRSIDEIEQFTSEINNFYEYVDDLKTKKAVERNLKIIGEAVSKILKTNQDFELPESQKIIGTRNRIIHNYDNISDEIIWSIIKRDLPNLKLKVEELLPPQN